MLEIDRHVRLFPLLADPQRYRACDSDLLKDEQARQYWLDLFSSHFAIQLRAAAACGADSATIAAVNAAFQQQIDLLRVHPDRFGRLDILLLDELRGEILRSHGIIDEFRLVKLRENEAAMLGLPARLEEIDRLPSEQRLPELIRGILAGNLFDMGVVETARRYADASVPFHEALAAVPPRPWLIDHLDAACASWLDGPPSRTLIFADNAGSDAVLGMLPLARELVQRGAEVTITANSQPSLNDVTARELADLRDQAATLDSWFSDARLRIVASGNAAPLIDLAAVSPELCEACQRVDLIVLIGMGRGIESNFSAAFRCQSWTIAMIKDPQVARGIGGKLLDAVMRVKPPAGAG